MEETGSSKCWTPSRSKSITISTSENQIFRLIACFLYQKITPPHENLGSCQGLRSGYHSFHSLKLPGSFVRPKLTCGFPSKFSSTKLAESCHSVLAYRSCQVQRFQGGARYLTRGICCEQIGEPSPPGGWGRWVGRFGRPPLWVPPGFFGSGRKP